MNKQSQCRTFKNVKTMKTTKLFFMAALALTFAACSNDDNDFENPAQQPAEAQGIPFTATISMGGDKATTRALSENGSGLTATWTVDEEVALIHNGIIDKVTVASVDGNVATISGTITTDADGASVTVIFPYSAVDLDTKDVKADLLYAQSGGTLDDVAAKYDVRKGNGTLKVSGTASLNDDVTLNNQFAIFKFTTKSVPSKNSSLENTNMTELTVTIGAQDYVITPASATSTLYVAMAPATASAFKFEATVTLYAALPAVDDQAVTFTATDGSNLYFASKASVSFAAAKYYQSTVKMGKVIQVFLSDDPKIGDFANISSSLRYHYLHIGLDQAYAIAKQLSNGDGDPVAVVYNHNNKIATYALSSDDSATERTGSAKIVASDYRAFLATLWESAQ